MLSALHKRDDMRFNQAMDTARAEVMASLSAASWESYQRAYTYCLQLQCLQEIEHMHSDMGPIPLLPSSSIRSPQSSASTTLSTLHQHWMCRLNRTIPSFKVREPLLSVRRVLCEEYGEMAAVGSWWLEMAQQARKAGQYETAAGALLHAEERKVEPLLLALARAKLMRGKGQKDEALQYLDKLHTEYDTNGLSANTSVVIPYSSSNIVLSPPIRLSTFQLAFFPFSPVRRYVSADWSLAQRAGECRVRWHLELYEFGATAVR